MTATARTTHKTVSVDGIDVFYREAGPADAPAVLLLHGFPTSSQMFRDLIPKLAGEPYARDLRTVETHLLDAGHFALETHADEVAALMRSFLGRHVASRRPS